MKTRVLVTGAGGFIGAEVVRQLLQFTDHEVVGLDSFRHRGVTDRLTVAVDGVRPWMFGRRFQIVRHDLAAPISVQLASHIGPVDVVLALASGSHVDTSIDQPREFTENNVAVALTTLEYVREYCPHAHLVVVSTDEVYGPVEPGYLHPEWDAVVPSNPYSASKAAQEALAVAWWRTYGLAVSIVNMHNVYGPMQHPEKFIPKVIAKVCRGEVVEVHGAGPEHGSRHWLYLADAVEAIRYVAGFKPFIFDGGYSRPGRWNIASGDRRTNLETAQLVAAAVGKPVQWAWSEARPGRDQHYGLTPVKLSAAGWHAKTGFDEGIRETVDWYMANPEWLMS